MGLTRRRFATMTAGGMLASPFVRPAAAAASMTVAAPGGVFQQVFQAAVIDAFRRARPDIAVYYYPVSNPAQILGLLRQRQQPPQFDVVLLGPKTARSATSENLLEPMRPETMPVLSELVPAVAIQGVAGAAAMIDCLAMPHVPNATKQSLTSWRILWDPSVTQRIAIPGPPDAVGIGFISIASRLFARGLDRDSLTGGINAIKHMAPRVVSWLPRPDVYDFLIDENAAFGVAWNGIGQVRAKRNPEQLRMALPTDAPVRDIHTIHLVKGARQPDAARIFASYVLGAEAQSRIADNLFMTPVNSLARISPEASSRLMRLDDASVPLVTVDSPEIDDLRGFITTTWRETIMRVR